MIVCSCSRKVSLHKRTLNRTTPPRVAQALLFTLSYAEAPVLFASLCDLCALPLRTLR